MTYILTTKNNQYQLPMEDPEVKAWFDNFNVTQTHHILRQINVERMHQPFFDGKDNLTVIDLGANIGLFSLYAKDSATKLISVEPTPKTFNMLSKLTQGIANIEVLQGAAGNTDGEVTFFINENPTINSLVNNVGEEVTVQSYTIDSIMKKYNLDYVDFIKCDIEGSEMVALTDETISPICTKVGMWSIELHQTDGHTGRPWPGNLEENRQKLAALFQRHGYTTSLTGVDQLFAILTHDKP